MNYKFGVNYFIVKTKGRYDEKFTQNGKIIRPEHIDNSEALYQDGEVIASPYGLEIPKGATLFFNHYVTKPKKSGDFCIDEENNIFKVPYAKGGGINSMAFAYEYNGEVHALDDWLFVEPVIEELETTKSGLVIVQNFGDKFYKSGEQKPKRMHGKVKHIGGSFKDFDMKEGDEIVCKEGHEYKMEIQGKTLYRVWERFVLAKVI